MQNDKSKRTQTYQSQYDRLWERFDEASASNAIHMETIARMALDALEQAERHIFMLNSSMLVVPDEMTMDKAVQMLPATWSLSNTGITGFIAGYNACRNDSSK